MLNVLLFAIKIKIKWNNVSEQVLDFVEIILLDRKAECALCGYESG